MTVRVTSGRNAAPGLAIVFALVFGLGLTFATGQERSTSAWPVVTPESQGFDSGVLAELLEHVRTKGLPLHNLLLIRRGQLILDASLYPYSPEGLHDVASVTKSITSVLVGIAIDKGLIESLRQPVVSLLPAAVHLWPRSMYFLDPNAARRYPGRRPQSRARAHERQAKCHAGHHEETGKTGCCPEDTDHG
jgi:CubicO group peptidase (beta-lactamase class C family)